MTSLAYSGSAMAGRETANVLQLRFRGAANTLSGDDRRALFARALSVDPSLRSRVGEILARVRDEGDIALLAMARELDRASLSALEVPRHALDRAMSLLSPALR